MSIQPLGLPFYFLTGLASTGSGLAAPRRASAGPPPRAARAARVASGAAALGGPRA